MEKEQEYLHYVKASERLPNRNLSEWFHVRYNEGIFKDTAWHLGDNKWMDLDEKDINYKDVEWLDTTQGVLLSKEKWESVCGFIDDIATCFDHDLDAHRYNTMCRACAAEKLFSQLKQTEK